MEPRAFQVVNMFPFDLYHPAEEKVLPETFH